MSDTRATAQRYMDLLCAQKFSEAFDLLADDANYQIIGSTVISAPMKGRELIRSVLVGALSTLREPLRLQFKELIIDGNRVVGLASGEGVGPTGLPYRQPHYAMVLRIENGEIQDVVEFMDMVEVETVLLGKRLVPA